MPFMDGFSMFINNMMNPNPYLSEFNYLRYDREG